MVKIRSLGRRELRQVVTLLTEFAHDAATTHFLQNLRALYLPFHAVNLHLPLAMKFLPEIYVAIEDDKVHSLVWLAQDGARHDCWKIEQIIINPETDSSLAVTKQLLQYSISQLGAKGVETFLAYLHNSSQDGISLLKECGFRHCTRQQEWCLKPLSKTPDAENILTQLKTHGFREASSWDIKQLQSLYEESLPPEVRVSLRRLPQELHPGLNKKLIEKCKGFFQKAWVLPHHTQQYLLAYVSISSHDFQSFLIRLIVSKGYEEHIDSLLQIAIAQIYKNGSKIAIQTQSYDFQKTYSEVLQGIGFEAGETTEILVKDVFVPLNDKQSILKSPILLFEKSGGSTSPARQL